MQSLVTLAQILGLAGVSAGIFFLLFREIIQNKIFPTLNQQQGFQTIKLIMKYVFFFSVITLVLATVIQIFRTPNLQSIGFDLGGLLRAEAKFGSSQELFFPPYISRAEALETKGGRSSLGGVMTPADALQRYNRVAERLNGAFGAVRNLTQFKRRVSNGDVSKAVSEVQRIEFGTLVHIRDDLIDAFRNSPDLNVRKRIAEIGFLTGQLQELGLRFTEAEESYRRVLAAFPLYAPAASAYANLLAERGQREAGFVVAQEFVTSANTDPNSDSLLKSQAFGLRALMFLWAGEFDKALKDLNTSSELISNTAIGQAEEEAEAARRLNASAGIYVNLGNMERALQDIRRAITLFEKVNDLYEGLIAQMNLTVILIDSGLLREADDLIRLKLEPRVRGLASGDLLRGLFYIVRTSLYVRQRNVAAAEVTRTSAQAFFDPTRGDSSLKFRQARVRCLESRIRYLEGNWDAAADSAKDCAQTMALMSTARLTEQIESAYIQWKAHFKLHKIPMIESVMAEQLLSLPPNLQERASCVNQFIFITNSYAHGNRSEISKTLDGLIGRIIQLENRSGALLDVLNDALLLRADGSLDRDLSVTSEELNALREKAGAKQIDI
jgi:tetratricopeptide (TPR) repeat protein